MITKQQLKRLRKQDEKVLTVVIDLYMPLVKAIAYKILQPIGRTDSMDECINDVFLTVWQNASKFEGEPADFKKWIGTIAKYKAIDHYRVLTKRAQREQVKEELPPVAIYDKQERNELLLLLSGLPELDRDIFLMKYYLQLPNNGIAQRLDLTKAAVDNRLYRGKQTLAGQLKERWT